MIEAEKANYAITWMCTQLGIPRSSFYAWRKGVESAATTRRRELATVIVKLFDDFGEVYGCRRIARELNKDGVACSVGLVADLMREEGLRAVQPRAYKRTTKPGEDPVDHPDLIGGDFAAGTATAAPGQRLVGDITYLRTGEGWLYLATVIDLATRMVLGWQIATHMRTSLVIDALQMAIDSGHVGPDAIFHSDRGAQYTSKKFAAFCKKKKVRPSVGRTGVCWDNAVAESFFATLKNEMYYRHYFATRARARFSVAEYIEVFYNRKRMHSSLGYRTPYEALTDYQSTTPQAA